MKEKYRFAPSWYKYYNGWNRLFYGNKKTKELDIYGMNSILISYPHLLGDAVMLVPFLNGLREYCPNAKIDIVGESYLKTILGGLDIIDNFYDFGASSSMRGMRGYIKNRKAINTTINILKNIEYDVAIDPFCDFGASFIIRKIHAKEKVGFDFFGFDYNYTYVIATNKKIDHIVDDMLYLLCNITKHEYSDNLKYPVLKITKEQSNMANYFRIENNLQGRYVIGMHPGASQSSKKWSGYLILAEKILRLNENIELLIFQGPGEDSVYETIINQLSEKVRDRSHCIKKSLKEYIAILSICNQVVCNDSSCAHISAGLGIPVSVIYGQGCPEFIAPRSNRSLVNIIEVQNVNCKPCYQDYCPNGTLKCIAGIQVDDVFSKMMKIYEKEQIYGKNS